MNTLDQFWQDTTSKKKESLDSNRKVLETSQCECGNEYDSKVSFFIFGKEKIITPSMCSDCYKKKEDEERKENEYKERLIQNEDRFNRESLYNLKLKKATFDNYLPTNPELTKAKQIMMRYAKNFNFDNPVNLLMIGNYGTGKSHLAISTLKEILYATGYGVLFISTPKLLTKLRSSYSRGSTFTEDEVLNSLSRVSVLVLDDIGSEQAKPTDADKEQNWATSKLFEIIDNRAGRHTIFTSNFEVNELKERLGGRNFSRMMEDTHIIKMYGDDYRLRDFK